MKKLVIFATMIFICISAFAGVRYEVGTMRLTDFLAITVPTAAGVNTPGIYGTNLSAGSDIFMGVGGNGYAFSSRGIFGYYGATAAGIGVISINDGTSFPIVDIVVPTAQPSSVPAIYAITNNGCPLLSLVGANILVGRHGTWGEVIKIASGGSDNIWAITMPTGVPTNIAGAVINNQSSLGVPFVIASGGTLVSRLGDGVKSANYFANAPTSQPTGVPLMNLTNSGVNDSIALNGLNAVVNMAGTSKSAWNITVPTEQATNIAVINMTNSGKAPVLYTSNSSISMGSSASNLIINNVLSLTKIGTPGGGNCGISITNGSSGSPKSAWFGYDASINGFSIYPGAGYSLIINNSTQAIDLFESENGGNCYIRGEGILRWTATNANGGATLTGFIHNYHNVYTTLHGTATPEARNPIGFALTERVEGTVVPGCVCYSKTPHAVKMCPTDLSGIVAGMTNASSSTTVGVYKIARFQSAVVDGTVVPGDWCNQSNVTSGRVKYSATYTKGLTVGVAQGFGTDGGTIILDINL